MDRKVGVLIIVGLLAILTIIVSIFAFTSPGFFAKIFTNESASTTNGSSAPVIQNNSIPIVKNNSVTNVQSSSSGNHGNSVAGGGSSSSSQGGSSSNTGDSVQIVQNYSTPSDQNNSTQSVQNYSVSTIQSNSSSDQSESIYIADINGEAYLSFAEIDSLGNTWVGGVFNGTMKLGNLSLSSQSNFNDFVAKLDKNGNWIILKSFFDPTISGSAIDRISFDSAGNAIFAYGLSVVKINSNNSVLWEKKVFNSTYRSKFTNVKIDSENNIIVSGIFYNDLTYGNSKETTDLDGDIFVAKLDSNAQIAWLKRANGSGEENVADMALANDNSIYITGVFGLTMLGLSDPTSYPDGIIMSLGDIIVKSYTAMYGELFVAKLDKSGNWIWARQEGRPNATSGVTLREINITTGQTTVRVDNNSRACGDILGESLSFGENNILNVVGWARGGMHYYGSSSFGYWGCNSYTQPRFYFISKMDTTSGNWTSGKQEPGIYDSSSSPLIFLDSNENKYTLASGIFKKLDKNERIIWSKNISISSEFLFSRNNQTVLAGDYRGCMHRIASTVCSNATRSIYNQTTKKIDQTIVLDCYNITAEACATAKPLILNNVSIDITDRSGFFLYKTL